MDEIGGTGCTSSKSNYKQAITLESNGSYFGIKRSGFDLCMGACMEFLDL